MMMKSRAMILIGFALVSTMVFVGAVVSPRFRSHPLVYAPLRELVLPEPQAIELLVFLSTEKDAWISEVVRDFDGQVNGRPVELNFVNMGSREMYLAVLDGEQPDIISPASYLQIQILEDLSERSFGRPIVRAKDPQQCRETVNTPLVLVAWKERAEVLWGSDPGSLLWQDLQSALVEPEGWAEYDHPEWGFVKFGQTNPLTSNSGFMTILLLTYEYHQKTGGLTSADILSDPGFQEWFLDFQDTISTFGDSTGTYMRDIIAYGPSAYDIVAVYEATAIEQAANAVGRYGELRIYYPPATVMSDHPFCILDAEWVSEEKAEAARLFIDYLLSPEVQETAVMKYGFRPADTVAGSITLDQAGSPFVRYQPNGVRAEGLPVEVEIPTGDVLNTLLDFWNRNINP